jgi:hypothetical protein
MSFYADPDKAALTLANRAHRKAKIVKHVRVDFWNGRIYINPADCGLVGRNVGLYDWRTKIADIASDIRYFLR